MEETVRGNGWRGACSGPRNGRFSACEGGAWGPSGACADGGMADRRLSASVARMLARGRALLTLGIAYMRASGLIEPDSCSYVPRRRSRVGARRVSCMPGMRRAAIAGQRKRCESGRGVTRAHAVEEVVEEHSGKMSQSSCTLLHSALCPRVTRAHTVEEVVEEVSQEHTHGQPPWCALRILG